MAKSCQTDGIMTIEVENQNWQAKLARVRRLTFAILIFERLWPLVLPVILVVLSFFALSWFGIFKMASGLTQIGLLLVFACLLFWCLLKLLDFRSPTRSDVDNRIEKASGLKFQPILAQYDALPPTSDEVAKILWQAHRQRLVKSLNNLQSGYPSPNIPRQDPYGLRSIVILSFAIAFAYSFSPSSGRIDDAFYFGKHADWSNMRVDAWVAPPEYTGRAPIYLIENNTSSKTDGQFDVPVNSIINLRISSADTRLKLTANWHDGDNTLKSEDIASKADDNSDVMAYDVKLTKAITLSLTGPHTDLSWNFNAIADQSPRISWEGDPKRAINGLLDLSYKIDDDYGAVKAWATMELAKDDDGEIPLSKGHQLFPVPDITLTLPRNGKGITRTSKDFAANPWAGAKVYMTLHAQDAAGNLASSEPKELVLPQRSFGNPLARALIEQRGLLIADTANKDHILDMLYAVQIRPKDTIKNATTVITLASVKRRLAVANNDEEFRNIADYLWDIAVGVEGGSLSAAAQRLKAAQQALRDALRNGASQEEIERLMAELKNAMSAYMDELAQSGQKLQQQPGQQMQDLSEDELQKKLKELEDLAKTGNRAAAEQLLSELEKMMDNMQVTQSEGGSGSGKGENKDSAKQEMQKNIDKLSDLMRRQQEMLNDTNKMTGEHQRGEKSDEDFAKDLDDLKKRQQDLSNDLKNLQEDLKKQGMKQGEGLDDAGQAMEQSQEALDNEDGESSTQSQADALDAMRNGAQEMMAEMREALKEKGEGTPNDDRKIDPLGREMGGEQNQHGDNAIPSESDIQKARRILDEIRKRLGNLTPEMERQYLERLLNFD